MYKKSQSSSAKTEGLISMGITPLLFIRAITEAQTWVNGKK